MATWAGVNVMIFAKKVGKKLACFDSNLSTKYNKNVVF
jgi:hypothetical protein